MQNRHQSKYTIITLKGDSAWLHFLIANKYGSHYFYFYGSDITILIARVVKYSPSLSPTPTVTEGMTSLIFSAWYRTYPVILVTVVWDTAPLIKSYDMMRSGSCGVSSCVRTDKSSSSSSSGSGQVLESPGNPSEILRQKWVVVKKEVTEQMDLSPYNSSYIFFNCRTFTFDVTF